MKFLRRLPIRQKIVAVTMLAAVAALLLAAAALFSYEVRGYRVRLEGNLETLAKIIGANSVAAISFADRNAAVETLAALRAEPQILAAAVYGLSGDLFATFTRPGFTASFPSQPGDAGFARSGRRLIYFGAIDDDREQRRIGTMYLEADYSGMARRLGSYAGILGLVLAVACLVALGLSTLLQRVISQPIIDLAAATRKVSTQQDYSFRVQSDSRDEFGPLFAGFNEMLHQIQARDAAVLEKNVALEEANRELESFSYSVSHDLRAPLRHVQGYVAMLQDEMAGKLPEKPQRFLRVINAASVEMGQLIDDLLDFSRMGRTEMGRRRVDLNALIQEEIERAKGAAPERNIVWKVASLPAVSGDHSMLRQVISNLLGNAVKYTRHRNPANIEIGLAAEADGQVVIFVRDNGAGFDMNYAQKLFGVFQRLHRADEFEGTGIGLATVRRIVSRHGGRVWAEGAVDMGAIFFFTLPRDANEAGGSAPKTT